MWAAERGQCGRSTWWSRRRDARWAGDFLRGCDWQIIWRTSIPILRVITGHKKVWSKGENILLAFQSENSRNVEGSLFGVMSALREHRVSSFDHSEEMTVTPARVWKRKCWEMETFNWNLGQWQGLVIKCTWENWEKREKSWQVEGWSYFSGFCKWQDGWAIYWGQKHWEWPDISGRRRSTRTLNVGSWIWCVFGAGIGATYGQLNMYVGRRHKFRFHSQITTMAKHPRGICCLPGIAVSTFISQCILSSQELDEADIMIFI